jgi:hypothetical protein
MAKVNHHIASIANIISTLVQNHGSLRAPEGRKLVLETLGVEETAFGHYANGNPKFPNLVSSAVASLRDEGKITTNGWTWTWGGTPTTSISTLPISTPVAMVIAQDEDPSTDEDDDDLFSSMEEEVDSSFLYDLTDEATLAALVASTECFGKFTERDSACTSCPLKGVCKEKVRLLKEARKDQRAERAATEQLASSLGLDTKAVKGSIPKSAQIQQAYKIYCQHPVNCASTGTIIDTGEEAVAVPSWGIITLKVFEIIKALNP